MTTQTLCILCRDEHHNAHSALQDFGCVGAVFTEAGEFVQMCACAWRPSDAVRKSGVLNVGTNGRGEVVVNHPRIQQDETGGHVVFSPEQASYFGGLMTRKAVEAALERQERGGASAASPDWPLSASETLYSFMGWLTTREQVLTLGADHDAVPAADVIAEFCAASGIENPRDGWEKFIALTPAVPR